MLVCTQCTVKLPSQQKFYPILFDRKPQPVQMHPHTHHETPTQHNIKFNIRT